MQKRGIIINQVFVYIVAIIIVSIILLYGAKAVFNFQKKIDQALLLEFNSKLSSDIVTLKNDIGSIKRKEYKLKGVDSICFAESYQAPSIPSGINPLVEDSIVSGTGKNIFLLAKGIEGSFAVKGISVEPDVLCIRTRNNAFWLEMESMGNYVIVREWKRQELPENNAPVLEPIGNKEVQELEKLEFTVTANDPDGDELIYSAVPMPDGAEFKEKFFGGDWKFEWKPGPEQAGEYSIEFSVSDGEQQASETVLVSVRNVNRAPVLSPIGNKETGEDQLLEFFVSASDEDGDILAYSAENLPDGAVFDVETRTFSWTPSLEQAGTYKVTFIAMDSSEKDSETIKITVGNANQPPVLESIGSKSINENEKLEFNVIATDPDNDGLTYTIEPIPAGAAFKEKGRILNFITSGLYSSKYEFSWTPTFEQAGTYTMTFTVDDGALTDSETIAITANNLNRAPTLNPVGNKQVNEGQLLQFSVSGSDPDGDALTFSASNLPDGASFDGKMFSWTPGFDQAGNYQIVFRARNGEAVDSESITITVKNSNRAPAFSPMGNKEAKVGEELQFTVSAADPDGDSVSYSVSGIPSKFSVWSFGNQDGIFRWAPSAEDIGTHTAVFTAHDGKAAAVTETITITVVSSEIAIKTCQDLQNIRNSLDANYYLANDIDCLETKNWNNGRGFDPIRNYGGVLDGRNHVVGDLYISHTDFYVGLFGSALNGVTIKNIGLVDAYISGAQYVGGFIGDVSGDGQALIFNSFVHGTVSGERTTGGLIGDGSQKTTIENSHFSGQVSSAILTVGGLVGGSAGIIKNSYSTGTVSGPSFAGGLIGSVGGSTTIENSYSTAAVSGFNAIGGLIGSGSGSQEIINSYSTGPISGNFCSTCDHGGLVGSGISATFPNSYYNSEQGVNTAPDGVGKTTGQMKQKATYAGWDFDKTWTINEDNDYPRLAKVEGR